MIWKTTVFGLLLCVVVDGGPAISEQKIVIHTGQHGELKHIGDKKPEHHDVYAWSYPSYEFSYKVKDPHTHDEKGQHEARHGDEVKGEYWLIEPDGRKRTVQYRAEKHSGFHAIVKYSGPLHHIRHKSEDEHKKHYEGLGNEGGEENSRERDENRSEDEGRDGDDSRGGEEKRRGDEVHRGEVEREGESEENQEGEKSHENEKDDFWSFISFGKKDKKKEWHGKKEESERQEEKSSEDKNSRVEGGERDGKRGGLFGYEWGRKYDSGREREDRRREESRGGEERGRDGDEKGGQKGGRANEEGRDREESKEQEGRRGNEDRRGGGRGGEGKGRGNNKGRDREGLSSYHIPMPYPKRIENFNARTYSHGRIYRAAPAHRQ